MKYCVKCEKQLADYAYFCSKCGNDAVEKLFATVTVNSGSQVALNVASSLQDSYSLKLSRFASCRPGDNIQFGRYPQNNGNIPEPIDWLVLAREGWSLFVISKYGLDCKPFNEERTSVTWEQCTLRKWLNNEFINTAFSEEEQAAIQVSHLRNDNNLVYGTSGGNNTEDKLFLLSIDEAGQYLAHGSLRRINVVLFCWKRYEYGDNSGFEVAATTFANSHGAYNAVNGNCSCWLRSPGFNNSYALNVYDPGVVYVNGHYVDNVGFAVRPALRISLLS